MSLRSRAWLVVAALSLAVVPPIIAPHEASAQQTIDAARARELFREATALMAGGDYASALSKLQQVASFKNTPQVRFNIGVCQEKLGRLVVALGEYRIAIADAEHDKKLKNVVGRGDPRDRRARTPHSEPHAATRRGRRARHDLR